MSIRVLIAEDDANLRQGLIDLLEGEGYEVFPAEDGQKALDCFRQEAPDLVLLDVMMPEMSGYDVCREIRKSDSRTPIIMLTAKGEEIDKPCKSCQALGYQGRTGIFELLIVTDQMREILVKQPKLELLKKAARASRQRSLQEEGVLLVAKGETSLPELMRVLKN